MPYGISNSFKRGTARTYSRRSYCAFDKYDADRPRKSIRMDSSGAAVVTVVSCIHTETNATSVEPEVPDVEASSSTIPSSPVLEDAEIFSDNALLDTDSDLSTPPLSPPAPVNLPAPPARKTAFSFLKRKRSEREPLAATSQNARKKPKPGSQAGFKQMQIDLGGEIRNTCAECGMEYIPSVHEDAALHKAFHGMNQRGVDVGKTLMRDAGTKSVLPKAKRLQEHEAVVIVDRRSSLGSRNKIKKVLEIVNSELSATEIDDGHLWGSIAPTSKVIPTRKTSTEGSSEGSARFKAFVFLNGDKCVGLCLVEKLSLAYRAVNPSDAESGGLVNIMQDQSSSVSISDQQDVALLGVSRIWTSRSYRRKGIAETLLDCARSHFFYGMEVTKDLIAFSQPTDSGCKLARQWFGAKLGWHVYRDED